MIGNVCEMVQERGTAKGGSAMDALPDFTISKDFKYSKPSGTLGFRCVFVSH